MKPIKPDFDLLIEQLEAEAKSLKRMIKNAAAEYDNLVVYYYSEALMQLNKQLDVLYNFIDPLYIKKKELKRHIEYIKKGSFIKRRKGRDKRMKDWQAKYKAELESSLQDLSDKPIKKNLTETQYLDEALFALYERCCKSFKLLINVEERFGLHFKLKRSLLIITIIGVMRNGDPDFVLDNRIPKPLAGLGFQLDIRSNKYFHTFDMTGFNNASEIKQWLPGS